MIRFFKSTQPATLVLIPLIVLLAWVRVFFNATPVTDSNALPLWKAISSILVSLPSWLNFIILIGLISAEALYLNLMINKHEVLYKNTFIPAIVFVLIISSTPGLMEFHPVHVINLILLRIFDRAFSMYKSEQPVSALFDTGFLAGLAALIYFPAIILFPLLITSLAVLRPFRLKEWIITIIAFFLPYFFLCTYMFWNHNLVEFRYAYMDHFHGIHPLIISEISVKVIVLASYIGLLLLLSLIKLKSNFLKNVIRTRSYQQIFLIFLLFGVAWLVLSGQIEIVHFAFLVIPISVFCSYYFVSAKNKIWIYEYILYGLIGVIIWNHLG